jgi:uncharacterized protein YprB with RNaseH-like and TPR domain
MNILDQSLCLLKGVSPESEIRLRRLGVLTCQQLSINADLYFSSKKANQLRDSFIAFKISCETNLVDWFVSHLPVGHRVRAIKAFQEETLFCDIETDGICSSSKITCISTLFNGKLETFWQGHNLNEFLHVWQKAKILVTFNGKRFDVPMICEHFNLSSPPPQVDLMYEASHYGLRGGLKNIERLIGHKREPLDCTNGKDAVALWDSYRNTGNVSALNQLIRYNQQDVLSLAVLSQELLKKSCENTMIDL